MKKLRSKLATIANALFNLGIKSTLSKAWKHAWKIIKLILKLKAGKAKFSFKKVSGEVREAEGTLNANLFTYESKGSSKKSNPLLIAYFDLERNAFRSFKAENLI